MQKLKLIAAIAAMTVAVPIASFAQSSPSPDNTAGPGIDPSVQAPTDMGIGSEDGIRAGVPERLGTAVPGYGAYGGYAAAPGAYGAYAAAPGYGAYGAAPGYGAYAAAPGAAYAVPHSYARRVAPRNRGTIE